MAIQDAPVTRARKVFEELIDARLSDVVVSPIDTVVTDEHIAGLQRGVYGYSEMILALSGRAHRKWIRPDPRWTPMTLRDVTLTVSGPDDMSIAVTGKVSTMVTLQLYILLRFVGDRVRQCECGRLFVRVRRQTHHSAQCQKKYYMRRFRAGEAGGE
jgi:hypothetical protein